MHHRLIALLALSAATVAMPADAQNAGYPARGNWQAGRAFPAAPPVVAQGSVSRWGGRIGGRWAGGYYAPGGWNAYRRPARGWTLPRYWIAPNFQIANYAIYGLSVPRTGYSWVRYYDDAVLIDRGGRVYDSVSGLDWDRYEGQYDGGPGYSGSYQGQTYQGQTYQGQTYQGTYQGTYGAPYAAPGYGFQGSYQGVYTTPPTVAYAPPAEIVQPTYHQQYATGGYAGTTIVNGVPYPGGTTTTITIASAPVVTTTTTEYIEEVEYRAPKVRRVVRKPVRKWRPARRQCTCSCGCR